MAAILLRAEGVNLSSFVFDCQDLSTVRGGGLILLDLSDAVEAEIRALGIEPMALTRGASQAMFLIPESSDPEGLAKKIEIGLSRHPQLRHATICVDAVQCSGDFPVDRARVIARNRWRQLRMGAVAYPRLHQGQEGKVCSTDFLRPAVRGEYSEATHVRRTHGIDQKHHFYEQEIATYAGRTGADFQFTNELTDLAASDVWGNLNGKMAVIHVDGNGIGALQREKCNTWERQREFSTGLRRQQAAFLSSLLDQIDKDVDWKSGDRFRLETLLWGGDEIIWVVPAWRGWELLRLFFENAARWSLLGTGITHSAGLVFCHHKAPIHEIVRLAKDLSEMAKRKGRQQQEKNLFAYQVLESFDHIGQPMDQRYLSGRYPFYSGDVSNPLVLEGLRMKPIAEAMPRAREAISKKKLYEVTKMLMTGTKERAAEAAQRAWKRMDAAVAAEAHACLDVFGEDSSRSLACWYHLAELVDYVAPEQLSN